MKFAIVLVTLVVTVIASGSVTYAGTYYVDRSHSQASDSNSGTAALPWKTIHKAAATLIAGDTVYVKAGTYTGTDILPKNSGALNKYITYSAYPGHEHKAIISGPTIRIKAKSYIVVNGFKIQNAWRGVQVEGPGSNIIVQNNYTYNTTSSGVAAFGVPWTMDPAKQNFKGLTKVTIKDNLIERACNGSNGEMITIANGVDTFTVSGNRIFNGINNVKGGQGIDVKEGASNGKIQGNEIHNIGKLGIYLDAGRGTYASATPKLTNIEISGNRVHDTPATGIMISTEGKGTIDGVKVFNNLVYRNNKHGIVVYQHPNGTGAFKNISIINNTAYDNNAWGVLLDHPTASSVTLRNTISYGNGTGCKCNFSKKRVGAGFQESNNLYGTDPKFVSATQANFALLQGSAAIDKGASAGAPSTDVAGVSRPQLTAFDIGGHEYRP